MVTIANEHTLEKLDLKGAYMSELIKCAETDDRIVDVEADLANCINGPDFKTKFPDRYLDLGICEQSLSSVSAGLSVVGKIPFCHSFASFASRRMCDQNYISCAYSQCNVKIVGSDPAISAGENGGTHQANEDIALMRPIANITIVEPTDEALMRYCVRRAIADYGIYYIRVQRIGNVKIYEEASTFEIGKANTIQDGNDVSLIATGNLMLVTCLKTAQILAAEGIKARVIDMFTIKPIDVSCIVKCAKETGAIVTAENHSIVGGLGSAVAEVLGENFCMVPLRRIGVPDRFGEVGQPEELQKVMKMTDADIAAAAKEVIAAKKVRS
jgi:transketolase